MNGSVHEKQSTEQFAPPRSKPAFWKEGNTRDRIQDRLGVRFSDGEKKGFFSEPEEVELPDEKGLEKAILLRLMRKSLPT